MRQLKHHEKKLLKKVDFLSVRSYFTSLTSGSEFTQKAWKESKTDRRPLHSGNRMLLSGKSRWCASITSKIERTITSESNSLIESRVSSSLPCWFPSRRYNKLCGSLRSLIHKLSLLPANDPFRQQKEAEMLDKLYDMGILGTSPTLEIHLRKSSRN